MNVDILAFGAHPDDVELSCGGTLHKAIQEGKTRVDIADGKSSVIEKEDAKAIVELYDRLSFDNQSLLVDRFFIDSKNMASVIDFAHKNRK